MLDPSFARNAADPAPPRRQPELHALLDHALTLPPEYDAGLSSHLPMALEALHALGASPARMQQFAQRYANRFRRTQATAQHVETPMPGRFDHFAAWRQHFARRLAGSDHDSALREALGRLMPGVAAAAFHGLIRVGHAVRAGHAGELHSALAYFASRYQPTTAGIGTAAASATEWLDGLTAIARSSEAVPGALISERMARWSGRAEVQALAGRLPPGALLEVARFAAQLYVATRNFTVLHVITASAALQRLRPWLHDASVRHVSPAVATALLASGALGTPAPGPGAVDGSAPDWPALAAAAIAQDDDHVIKLTLACRELDALSPDPVWRQAAARAQARK